MRVIALYLTAVNIIGFALFGMDKQRAVRHAWRIKESTLFITAIIGGSVGCIIGMQVFRHKTKHMKFVIGMPMVLIMQMAAVGIVMAMRMR